MYIKKKHFILASVFLLSLMGCSGENSPYNDIPVIELSGASCLTKAVSNLNIYIKGEATPTQTHYVWTCFNYALNTFQKYVRGQEGENYSSLELRNFLESYFLKDIVKDKKEHVITDSLLLQMMNLKKLFLGGSNTLLTSVEIDKTFKLIDEFRKISIDFLPSSPLIFKHDPNIVPTGLQFDKATEALAVAIHSLVKMFDENNSRYEIKNLMTLLSDLKVFFDKADPNSSFGEISKYIPSFATAKSLLLNTNEDAIEGREWPAFAGVLTQGITLALRSSYYFKYNSLFNSDLLSQFTKTVNLGIQILTDGLKRRDNVPYANHEFEKIVKKLGEVGALPLGLTVDDFKPLVSLFTNYLLSPKKKYPEEGLSLAKINYFYSEINSWSEVQDLLIKNKTDSKNPRWLEMSNVLSTPWSISLDSRDRLILNGDTKTPTNLAASTQLNWSRGLFSFLYRAYSQSKDDVTINTGLSRAELHKAYVDLKSILVALDLIEKDDKDFDKRLYRDTGLFMPVSDGNDYIGLNELIEYLHFVLAGKSAGQVFIDDANSKCRIDENNFDIECFRKNLPAKASFYFESLPFYLNYSNKLSSKNWERDIKSMERISRKDGATNTPIKNVDIMETFVLIQYIEVVMLRFDVDRSGDLDIVEGFKMLKLFKNIIGDLIGFDPDQNPAEFETIFTYILKYGGIPNSNDPLSSLRYFNWKNQPKSQWKIAADRGILLQILASISGLGSMSK
jgi:hypothetical protein